MNDEFREGQYVIYWKGNAYLIGKIERVTRDSAYIFFTDKNTAAKTPIECIHPIINSYLIGETNLGGTFT